MLQLIRHRVNSTSQLTEINPREGVEIDLRSDVNNPGALHLAHDPWVRGENFEEWLQTFKRIGIQGPLVLNTKEDMLETKVMSLLSDFGITNYFFIDTPLPTLVKQAQAGV